MDKMMTKLLMRLTLILSLVAIHAISGTVAAAPLENGCEACHKDQRFFVENKKLYNYYQDWLRSPHKQAGLSCQECHGGDATKVKKADAHQDMYPPSDPRSRVHYRNQVATCGDECHVREADQFKRSKHYKRLSQQIGVPSCSTCHRVMNRKPYYGEIAEITCQVCHFEGNREDLPLVARRADEAMHRLNIAKGYLNWARLYYKSQNWPGESRQELAAAESSYRKVLADIHRFRITRWGWDTSDLLAELKRLYEQAHTNEFGDPKQP